MDVGDIVRSHYGRAGLDAVLLAVLEDAGVDTERMTAADLGGLDQLHAGGVPATAELLSRLELRSQTRLLDVGCGIGGPSRVAAATYGCPVVGVDLSPDFVRAATALTERVGLGTLVHHEVLSADALGFEDGSFDRALMIHVGMNLPDKGAVFAEVRRVLRPGGLFGLFEQMRTGEGALPYPMPWARDASSSFVSDPATYVELLEAAGFDVVLREDRTGTVTGAAAGRRPGSLGPAAVFGPGFTERFDHLAAATRAGLLAPVLLLARAR
jgi:MPBQ/MSBQ methyltransferase